VVVVLVVLGNLVKQELVVLVVTEPLHLSLAHLLLVLVVVAVDNLIIVL
jgi:hypothetical protein